MEGANIRKKIKKIMINFIHYTFLRIILQIQQITLMIRLSLLLILCLCAAADEKCGINGVFNQAQGMCECSKGFLGKACNVQAYQLKSTQTKIPISNNFVFAYFTPQEKVIYRFILTFCSPNKTQQLNIVVFAQQEQINGEIDLIPTNSRELLGLSLGGSQECKQIYSTILVSVDKKLNEQLPKIVFGIRLFGKSAILQGQFILSKCQVNSIFTISFLLTIIISFFTVVMFFMLISIIILLRKKLKQKKWAREQELKKMQCVNKMMPIQKYETLIEEGDNSNEHICSICLSQFEQGQNVRRTPCGHIYHEVCLDSWCHSHLNCPICRKNFEDEQQMQIIQQSLRPDTNNIRQAML